VEKSSTERGVEKEIEKEASTGQKKKCLGEKKSENTFEKIQKKKKKNRTQEGA